ncbi:DUF1272 domain-containing protein [uncultured Croceitalea sp.]|uniref:DUF1272 domain-containing protein n=1 Tax=uncultured Croceitalea sp. TaxID=1798908 RepID=UPI0033068A7E
MLEIRTYCEHCDKSLPSNSIDAMICSSECICKERALRLFEIKKPRLILHHWEAFLKISFLAQE